MRQNTPLKFHKFIRFIALPVGILFAIYGIYSTISDPNFEWLYIIDIGFYLLYIGLALTSFIGFFAWKPYAWYSIMGFLATLPLNSILSLIFINIYHPELTSNLIPRTILTVLYSLFVGLYYFKRKHLFIP